MISVAQSSIFMQNEELHESGLVPVVFLFDFARIQ